MYRSDSPQGLGTRALCDAHLFALHPIRLQSEAAAARTHVLALRERPKAQSRQITCMLRGPPTSSEATPVAASLFRRSCSSSQRRCASSSWRHHICHSSRVISPHNPSSCGDIFSEGIVCAVQDLSAEIVDCQALLCGGIWRPRECVTLRSYVCVCQRDQHGLIHAEESVVWSP